MEKRAKTYHGRAIQYLKNQRKMIIDMYSDAETRGDKGGMERYQRLLDMNSAQTKLGYDKSLRRVMTLHGTTISLSDLI